jgi:hypothetical protein
LCYTASKQAPIQLLALIDAAIATLARAATPDSQAAGAEAPAGSFLQACRTRLVLLSQLPASQLQQQLLHDQTADENSNSTHPAESTSDQQTPAAAAAAGFAGIKSIAVPPLRARASDIAPMALQAALPEALLRGYTAVELTDAAELQLAGKVVDVCCLLLMISV